MKTKCDCGSLHLNTYKHELGTHQGKTTIIRWVNCLDCNRQVAKRVDFVPVVVGK